MKITEALCNVITEAGGTPTTADSDSVTHALGTLYTTLGGTDTLPDDVADRINSLSDHIGGGAIKTSTADIVNNTGKMIMVHGLKLVESGSDTMVGVTDVAVMAGQTKEIMITPSAADTRSTPVGGMWAFRLNVMSIADPSKVTASTTVGNVYCVRAAEADTGSFSAFLVWVYAPLSDAKPVVTFSVSA